MTTPKPEPTIIGKAMDTPIPSLKCTNFLIELLSMRVLRPVVPASTIEPYFKGHLNGDK